MSDSVLGAIRTYLAAYTGLPDGAPLWVGYLGPGVTGYSIVPLAGDKFVEKYVDGGSTREFPFAFRSMESTADDLERLATAGFYEAFAAWMEAQTLANNLPSLAGTPTKTAEIIEATGWGYLMDEGPSFTGVYQVNCRLVYSQAAP